MGIGSERMPLSSNRKRTDPLADHERELKKPWAPRGEAALNANASIRNLQEKKVLFIVYNITYMQGTRNLPENRRSNLILTLFMILLL
jgi:hypothetical protein